MSAYSTFSVSFITFLTNFALYSQVSLPSLILVSCKILNIPSRLIFQMRYLTFQEFLSRAKSSISLLKISTVCQILMISCSQSIDLSGFLKTSFVCLVPSIGTGLNSTSPARTVRNVSKSNTCRHHRAPVSDNTIPAILVCIPDFVLELLSPFLALHRLTSIPIFHSKCS